MVGMNKTRRDETRERERERVGTNGMKNERTTSANADDGDDAEDEPNPTR